MPHGQKLAQTHHMPHAIETARENKGVGRKWKEALGGNNNNDNDHSFSHLSVHEGQSAWALADSRFGAKFASC